MRKICSLRNREFIFGAESESRDSRSHCFVYPDSRVRVQSLPSLSDCLTIARPFEIIIVIPIITLAEVTDKLLTQTPVISDAGICLVNKTHSGYKSACFVNFVHPHTCCRLRHYRLSFSSFTTINHYTDINNWTHHHTFFVLPAVHRGHSSSSHVCLHV